MNLIQEMGIKDLEHVVLKAYNPMSLGGRVFEAGEPVLLFKNLQIALLSENTHIVAARGGYLNQPRVIWEDRNDTTFQFSNGTINPLSLNLLLEANMLSPHKTYIPFQEIVELDDDGNCFLSHLPAKEKKIFYKTFLRDNLQDKIVPKETKDNFLSFGEEYANKDIIVDYYFVPKQSPLTYTMNRERQANLYTLEATFYLKDENEGLLHTGILEMPKIYIMSNINLRMGEIADPTVGTFKIVAMPENLEGYEQTISRITFLDDDIYSI